MKKKTRKKKVVRRKRRSRKSMSEKRVMKIKRGLMKSAKKLRLGAERTGAYVYGTLRRIVGNRGLTPRQQKMLDFLKKVYPQYSELARDSATKKDASRLARLKLIKVRSFKRTGTSRGKRFSMMIIEARAMAPKGGQLSSPVLGLARNPAMFVKNKDDIEKVRKQLDNGFVITEVSKTRNGIRVLLSSPRPGERIVYGESFNDYANRVFVPMLRKNPYVSKILGDMKSQQLKYRGFTIILERQPNTILATWTDGDTLQSQRYSGYSFREVYEVVKDEIDDLIKPSRPGMLRGNPGEQRYTVDADRRKNYSLAEARRIAEERTRRFGMRGIYRSSSIFPYKKPVRANPPMYAHGMTAHRTHGLSLKQMMKLYRLVSSGNQKAVMFARRTLGIPMSESLSQVKAVVYHHILDLKGKI
jgi:hypothetical protein